MDLVFGIFKPAGLRKALHATEHGAAGKTIGNHDVAFVKPLPLHDFRRRRSFNHLPYLRSNNDASGAKVMPATVVVNVVPSTGMVHRETP